MGRHRRHAAGRAATTGRVPGEPNRFENDPELYTPENLYGFAAVLEADAQQGRRSHRKQKKTVTPVKTGLLGVSAAVALGTVAVATGVLPGSDKYAVSGGASSDVVAPAGSPTELPSQQGGSVAPADRSDESASRGTERRPASPSVIPSGSGTDSETEKPSGQPEEKPTEEVEAKPGGSSEAAKTPSEEAERKPDTGGTVEISAVAQVEAEVLKLVNEERVAAGCSPVAANSALSKLARSFSQDMASRGYFDHTDPDGDTPWDRAASLGIPDLGGENIARGQATAEAVMNAWMNSPGHKANILNCDFKTLGVGVHLGDGGPWWTQDFGY